MAGCRLYVVSRDPQDADALWVMEVWAVQQLIARARPVIAGMGLVTAA